LSDKITFYYILIGLSVNKKHELFLIVMPETLINSVDVVYLAI